MGFNFDEQTSSDLQIGINGQEQNTIFGLFSKTQTVAGRECLRLMLKNPMNDVILINDRITNLAQFAYTTHWLTINKTEEVNVNYYFNSEYPLTPRNQLKLLRLRLKYMLRPSSEIYNIYRGIRDFINLLSGLKKFIFHLETGKLSGEFKLAIINAHDILNENIIMHLMQSGPSMSFWELIRYDALMRRKYRHQMVVLMRTIDEIDAYQTITVASKAHQLVLPEFVTSDSKKPVCQVDALWYPLLENPVYNDFSFDKNLCMLTGPNMAGKSTFLRAVGIAVFLAHCGFPVPAKSMTTSVYNGLITTINLNDHPELGYSHFYSEVDRLKGVIEAILEHDRMFVIFDELFRGTNIKDALDGTVLVAEGLMKTQMSKSIISTHIIEAIEELGATDSGILLQYFSATFLDGTFHYDYQIKKGYSSQYLGVEILKREGIPALLESLRKH